LPVIVISVALLFPYFLGRASGLTRGDKGSFAPKAAVVGDTAGDPFKDRPAMLTKLLATLTLVLVGQFIKSH